MKTNDLVIYAYDFKPRLGGVAEYAYRLAVDLHKRGKLLEVCAPFEDPGHEFVYHSANASDTDEWRPLRLFRPFARMINPILLKSKVRKDVERWIKYPKGTKVLITSHYGEAAVKATIELLKARGISYGILMHGLDIIMNHGQDADSFKTDVEGAEFVIFNSKATKSLFAEYYPGVKLRSVVMYPGIDPKYLEAIEEESIPGLDVSVPLISFVGRLVKRKGPDLAIYAMQVLKNKGVNSKMVIAGDGPMLNDLNKIVDQLDLRSHVMITGPISEGQKAWLFKKSVISVLPNRALSGMDFEGFGISNIEAAFYGNVAIGGVHGGVPEAIQHEAGGYIMDFEDDDSWKALADNLLLLLADPVKVNNMAQEGRRIAISTFDWKVLINKMLEDLKSI